MHRLETLSKDTLIKTVKMQQDLMKRLCRSLADEWRSSQLPNADIVEKYNSCVLHINRQETAALNYQKKMRKLREAELSNAYKEKDV